MILQALFLVFFSTKLVLSDEEKYFKTPLVGKQNGIIMVEVNTDLNQGTGEEIKYYIVVNSEKYLLCTYNKSTTHYVETDTFYSQFFYFHGQHLFKLHKLDWVFLNETQISVNVNDKDYLSDKIKITMEPLDDQEKNVGVESKIIDARLDSDKKWEEKDEMHYDTIKNDINSATIGFYSSDQATRFTVDQLEEMIYEKTNISYSDGKFQIESPDYAVLGLSFGLQYTHLNEIQFRGFIVRSVGIMDIDSCNGDNITWKFNQLVKLSEYTIYIMDDAFGFVSAVTCIDGQAECTITPFGQSYFAGGTFVTTNFTNPAVKNFKMVVVGFTELYGTKRKIDMEVIDLDYDAMCLKITVPPPAAPSGLPLYAIILIVLGVVLLLIIVAYLVYRHIAGKARKI